MRCWRQIVAGPAVLLFLFPLLGEADSPNENVEHNQRLLEKWRKDPEHYERLRRNGGAFLALPEERQQRLRQLDQDLHAKDSATTVRLHRVLERYAEWLQRLPDADRQRLQLEPDPKKRLQLVRELRESEWVQRLPKAVREELQKLPADQQRLRIAELRTEEHKRRQEWQTAIRNWTDLNRPQMIRLEELTPEAKIFVNETLLPMLTPQEKNLLLQAQGKYPLFLRTLVELADKHPLKIPGPSTGPTQFEQLPPGVQARLAKVKEWPSAEVKEAEGKWPDYAQAVMTFARKNNVTLPKQLGPCRPAEFSSSVRQFIDKQLIPVLSADDAARLSKAEGRWPWYPNLLFQLARKHGLQVPGMGLPGPRETWNRYRTPPATSAGE